MTGPLAGKVVLLTGSGSGIGRGIASALTERGATVVATARDVRKIDDLATDGNHVTRCDLTDAGSITDAVAYAVEVGGGLDAVIHNAVSRRSSDAYRLEDLDDDRWEDLASVSLRGSYLLARASFGPLAARGGSLVLLTSINGVEGARERAGYAAVKAGQRGLAKSLAREWGPRGVRVNCIAPLAETESSQHGFEESPKLRDHILSYLPMGRFGDPRADIGGVAAFLVGDDSRYVTGQTIPADGGLYLGF